MEETIKGIHLLLLKAEAEMRAAKTLLLTPEYRSALPHINMTFESLGKVWHCIESAGFPKEVEVFWSKKEKKDQHKRRLVSACHFFGFLYKKRTGKNIPMSLIKVVYFSCFLKNWNFYVDRQHGEFVDKAKNLSLKSAIDEYCFAMCFLHEVQGFVPTISPRFLEALGQVIRLGKQRLNNGED